MSHSNYDKHNNNEDESNTVDPDHTFIAILTCVLLVFSAQLQHTHGKENYSVKYLHRRNKLARRMITIRYMTVADLMCVQLK